MTATLTDPRPTTRGVGMIAGGLLLVASGLAALAAPRAGHTGGLRTPPAAYERRTTAFLDQALGLKETP